MLDKLFKPELQEQRDELLEFAKRVVAWYESAGNEDPDQQSIGSDILWSEAKALVKKNT
jgi:hypothetical protein